MKHVTIFFSSGNCTTIMAQEAKIYPNAVAITRDGRTIRNKYNSYCITKVIIDGTIAWEGNNV